MLRREFILNYFGSFATGNYVSIGFYSLISLLELIKKYVVLKKKKTYCWHKFASENSDIMETHSGFAFSQ